MRSPAGLRHIFTIHWPGGPPHRWCSSSRLRNDPRLFPAAGRTHPHQLAQARHRRAAPRYGSWLPSLRAEPFSGRRPRLARGSWLPRRGGDPATPVPYGGGRLGDPGRALPGGCHAPYHTRGPRVEPTLRAQPSKRPNCLRGPIASAPPRVNNAQTSHGCQGSLSATQCPEVLRPGTARTRF